MASRSVFNILEMVPETLGAAFQARHQPYRCNEPGVLRENLHAK